MKRAALLGVLRARLDESRIHVVSDLGAVESPSTRLARLTLENIGGRRLAEARFLVVHGREDELSRLSVRNLRTVHALPVDQLNTYDVLRSDFVVFLRDAYLQFIDEVSDEVSEGLRAATSGSDVDPAPFVDQEGVDIGALPSIEHEELLEIGHEDEHTLNISTLDLQAAFRNATAMTKLRAFERQTEGLEAVSFSTVGVDPVAVERHEGFVLVSWPATVTSRAALGLLRPMVDSSALASEVTLYAGSEEAVIEHEDGDPIDWDRLADLADSLSYIRLELADQTVVWRRAEGPDERDDRFVLLDRMMDSESLLALVEATADTTVSDLLIEALGRERWQLEGMPSIA